MSPSLGLAQAMSEDVKHELRNSQLLHGTRAAPRSGSMASRARPWAMRTSRQDADEPEEASRGVGGEAAGGASRGSVEPPSVQATAARGEGGSSAAASVRRFPRPVSRPAEQLPEEARHTGVGQARPVIKVCPSGLVRGRVVQALTPRPRQGLG